MASPPPQTSYAERAGKARQSLQYKVYGWRVLASVPHVRHEPAGPGQGRAGQTPRPDPTGATPAHGATDQEVITTGKDARRRVVNGWKTVTNGVRFPPFFCVLTDTGTGFKWARSRIIGRYVKSKSASFWPENEYRATFSQPA